MSKPQVLVFVDWYKPGYKGGGPVRSMMNLVDHLGDRVDLWFVTSDTDYTATEPYPGIVPDRWTKLPSGEHVWYASRTGRTRKAWQRLLTERAWDTVYINGMFSWWYSVMPLVLLRGQTQRRIVAARGMLLPGPMRQGALKKRIFLNAARMLGLYRGVAFQSTSADETASIKHWIGTDIPVHLVPNLPRKVDLSKRPARPKTPGQVRLVNVVRIATEKNIHLIIQSLHGLRGEVSFDLFKRIGLNVEAQAMDWATVVQRRTKQDPVDQGGWSVFHTSWGGVDQFNPAVHAFLRGNGKQGIMGWPNSPTIEALRAEWFLAPDLAAQKKVCETMQLQAFRDVPYIPLGQVRAQSAHRANLEGVLTGLPVFWNVKRAG